MKRLFFILLLFIFPHFSFAKQKVIDSLKTGLSKAQHDSTRCDIYISWGEEIYLENPDSAIILWQNAEALAEKNISKDTKNKSIYNLRLANALSDIGSIYHYQGNIPKALENLYKSLKACEEMNNKSAVAITLNNIGAIYFDQRNYPKAFECYEKSLKIHEEMNDKRGIGNALNNIASIYDKQGNSEKALLYLLEGLKNYEAIGHKRGIASSLNNIAGIYKDQKNTAKAFEYFSKSLKIREELGDKEGIAVCLNNLAILKLSNGEIDEALTYSKRSVQMAKDIGYPMNIQHSANTLKKIFQKQNKFKEAFEMYELEIQMQDSINNQETQKALVKKQLQYDYEKKEAVADATHKNELKNQEIISEEKNRKQKLITSFVIGGLLLVLVFAGFVFRTLRITRKQKALIEHQKLLVEEHQKGIIDSITYAKRIQKALLPTEKYIEKNMNRLKK